MRKYYFPEPFFEVPPEYILKELKIQSKINNGEISYKLICDKYQNYLVIKLNLKIAEHVFIKLNVSNYS